MSNLPPGVTEGMIPGNRPIDLETEHLFDEIYGLIVTFVDASAVVAMYDVPEILSDLTTEIERDIKADWEAQKQKCKLPPVNRCRFCGEIPEDCECSRGKETAYACRYPCDDAVWIEGAEEWFCSNADHNNKEGK